MEFQVIFWHLLRGIRGGGPRESRCVGQGLSPGSPKYEARAINCWLEAVVLHIWLHWKLFGMHCQYTKFAHLTHLYASIRREISWKDRTKFAGHSKLEPPWSNRQHCSFIYTDMIRKPGSVLMRPDICYYKRIKFWYVNVKIAFEYI
jgi:hypothetical protein